MIYHWSRFRLAVFLMMMFAVSGCVPADRVTDSASPTATRRHDPSQAEIGSLRRELAAIPGVQSLSEFTYRKGTFENGATTDATFDTTKTTQKDLVKILDTAYRLTWDRSDIAMGGLTYVVQNPKTGAEAGAPDLGFDVLAVGYSELLERYGPVPTTSAQPS